MTVASRIAVAAGDDVSVERREGFVDQQGVVYVAARRADIDDDFRSVDFAQPVEAVPEFFVGGYARRGLVELPLLGDADHPFDVHEAGVVAVGDLNVGLHGKLFFCRLARRRSEWGWLWVGALRFRGVPAPAGGLGGFSRSASRESAGSRTAAVRADEGRSKGYPLGRRVKVQRVEAAEGS